MDTIVNLAEPQTPDAPPSPTKPPRRVAMVTPGAAVIAPPKETAKKRAAKPAAKKEPAKKGAVKKGAVKESAAKSAKGEPQGRRAKYPPDSVIKMLTTENPKRAGSAAYKKFALLKDGMTVAQLMSLESKHDFGKHWPRSFLRNRLRDGHVKLVAAK